MEHADCAPFLDRWRPHQPNPPPPGWSSDFSSDSDDCPNPAPFLNTMRDSIGRQVEHEYHILGDIVPLLWQRDDEGDIVIAQAGGLLLAFLYWHLTTLGPGVTAPEVARAVEEGNLALLPHSQPRRDRVSEIVGLRFEEMWMQEWATTGRNRWAELRERGGEVDRYWTEGGQPSAHIKYGPREI